MTKLLLYSRSASSKEIVDDAIRDSLRHAQRPSLTCSGMVADSVRDSCLSAQEPSATGLHIYRESLAEKGATPHQIALNRPVYRPFRW